MEDETVEGCCSDKVLDEITNAVSSRALGWVRPPGFELGSPATSPADWLASADVLVGGLVSISEKPFTGDRAKMMGHWKIGYSVFSPCHPLGGWRFEQRAITMAGTGGKGGSLEAV